MDLSALRADLATVAKTAGFNAWSYMPDDPKDLPAAVVAGVRSMSRLTIGGACVVELEVELYVNATDPEDASKRLDLALSLGVGESFLTILEAIDPNLDKPAWRSARFVTAGPYTRVAMPGGGVALSVAVLLELTA